ncbi:MAG: NAD-dependent deacetylase [Spirochaetaceae bacterium]|jgi:NAD-dependent deacetylase|nr:NAD-dependent deacetylase [Spirochaetaceae bacterium]
MDTVEKLFEKISGARHCIALTGAGISTLSGIRDFRGKNGLYQEEGTEKIFDIDYFRMDPSFYYNAAASFIYNIHEKEPSVVHTTLGNLEQRGFLKAVITQNIDLLHQKGGSRRVIEIHGSPSIHYCPACSDPFAIEDLAAAPPGSPFPPGDLMRFEEVAGLVKAGELPRCVRCGGVLKPAITFFGESLPVRALRAAEDHARKADLMLVLGTSLTVYPAAALPEITLQAGGNIVIVNNQATPQDGRAALHFNDLREVFEGLSFLIGTT